MRMLRQALGWMLLVAVLGACAPTAPTARTDADSAATAPASSGPKRITAAIQSDPPFLANGMPVAGNQAGLASVVMLYNPGLAAPDRTGALAPVIAERVPSVENGTWRLFPDGRMETTWQIKPGVTWHDGTPFTAEDLAFTHEVQTDRAIPLAQNVAFQHVESVAAPDARTFVVTWHRPYIEADVAFTGSAMPRHLLESTYRDAKERFTEVAYWGQPPLGVGAYRVEEWERGSHIILQANPDYVLGRPRIDTIEVKIIPDLNGFVANILAGSVELTLGKTITLEQALEIQPRWSGKVEISPANPMQVYPQMLTPNPAIVGDARFRRALYHALDRQEMVDTIMSGMSTVTHSYLAPTEPPEFQAQAHRIVKYEYDARRTAQIMEGLGYVRGPDSIYRDPSGQPLSVELRAGPTGIDQKTMFVVADFWQRAGIGVETVSMPAALSSNPEYRATFPAFETVRNAATSAQLRVHHSSQTALPENGWRGSNRTRYMNPEFDAMLDRFFSTIPMRERADAFGDIIAHMTDVVIPMGLFYDVDPVAIGRRVLNVMPPDHNQTWNAQTWDARD